MATRQRLNMTLHTRGDSRIVTFEHDGDTYPIRFRSISELGDVLIVMGFPQDVMAEVVWECHREISAERILEPAEHPDPYADQVFDCACVGCACEERLQPHGWQGRGERIPAATVFNPWWWAIGTSLAWMTLAAWWVW